MQQPYSFQYPNQPTMVSNKLQGLGLKNYIKLYSCLDSNQQSQIDLSL